MIRHIWSAVVTGILVSCGDSGGGGLSGTGTSGSTSRFAVVGEHLYILNQYEPEKDSDGFFSRPIDTLDTFSIQDAAAPVLVNRLEFDPVLPETLHAVGRNLFVGTSSGMQIISLAEPESPDTLSFTRHFTARDPVVVSGSTAYVTLRTEETATASQFARGRNELQIYDVSDLENPQQLSTFEMTAPWGIGVRHSRAYICDGSAGLRVLSVADPQDVKGTANVDTDICFDVVVTEDLLISTGAGGVNQYRIGAGSDAPVLISTIAIQQ